VNDLKKGQRLTETAAGLEGFLALSKVVIGLLSGSIVLISDALHSVFDLLTIFASWLGLKMAQKDPDEKFSYGYYKAESLATLFISLLIFYAFIQMFFQGYSRLQKLGVIELPFFALGISLVDAAVLFFFGRYEIKVGKEINSQSLISLGKENRTHLITSSAVFLGTLATVNQIPYVEGIITLLVSGLIFKIGLETIREGILGLMDVSPDEEVKQKVIAVVESVPGVKEAFDLKLRKSGPYLFGQTKVGVSKKLKVKQSHQLADQVEEKVKNNFDGVSSFIVHVEPYVDEFRHLVLPIEEDQGLNSFLSNKFGRAPYFLFVNLEGDKIKGSYIIKNPYVNKKVRVGLAVVKLINKQQVDTLITKEIGEISFHTLRDYLIDIYQADENTGLQVINLFTQRELKELSQPTKRNE
jgi:cation diffusion facilitator family transporter